MRRATPVKPADLLLARNLLLERRLHFRRRALGGNEQIYCAADRLREGLLDSHRSNDGRMTDQKNSPISKNHDSGNITEVCLFIIIFGSAKTEPAPATINFGTGLPQTRFRERIW